MTPGGPSCTSRWLRIVAFWLHGLYVTRDATWLQARACLTPQIQRMETRLVVLIAENDRDMRDYVRRCVEMHDLEIEEILEARDGQQALEIARSRPIDLLVTDGAMPRLDGFALCEAIRSEQTGQRTRVLVITGQFDLRVAERRARSVGADGLLLKPFNALTLCGKIDEVLNHRSPRGRERKKS